MSAIADWAKRRLPGSQAGEGEDETGPDRLRRSLPLVPLDTASTRALSAVLAILTFLAALCAGAAALVADSSAQWRSSIAREATIQVRPTEGGDIEAKVAQAASLARATPGIASVEPFSKVQSERLLEPWLGKGLDLGELPVPRLIVLKLAADQSPDFDVLKEKLAAEVPEAMLDDHRVWLERLAAMAGTLVALALGLVGLVLAAAGLAAIFATRGAMAGNREVIDVLHFVGANDRFIAREFQRRFLQLGLKGALIGCIAAVVLLAGLGTLSSSMRGTASGAQIEALFGTFGIGWSGYGMILLVAFVVAGITGIVSGWSVRRHLGDRA